MIDATAAALLGSAAISSAGSYAMNHANIKYAENTLDTQIGLANTAHQREIRDLEAAGLNPILSASSSGSAVPQLTAPSISENLGKGVANALHSAASLYAPQVKSQIEVNDAYRANLEADGELKKAKAALVDALPVATTAKWIKSAFDKLLPGSSDGDSKPSDSPSVADVPISFGDWNQMIDKDYEPHIKYLGPYTNNKPKFISFAQVLRLARKGEISPAKFDDLVKQRSKYTNRSWKR